MNSTFKTLIRTMVVATNPLPPFKWLNRLPYTAALRQLRQLSTRYPEVASLYLRHGLTRNDWEPGLSDIDLTLVVRSGLSAREELAFMQRFVLDYGKLRRFFPMLGELDILIEPYCSAWTRFSQRGAEAEEWSLLYGDDLIIPAYVNTGHGTSKDRMDHACLIYQSQVLRRSLEPRCETWIESRALSRIAAKTLRYSGGGPDSAKNNHTRASDRATADLLRVFERLDERATAALPALAAGSPALPIAVKLPESRPHPGYRAERYLPLMELQSLIQSLTLSFTGTFIVLRNGAASTALREALIRIREFSLADKLRSVIVTPSLLQYYLRAYRPRWYLEFSQHRYVMLGDDLIAGIVPPSGQSLAAELLGQSLNCVLAPARFVTEFSTAAAASGWAGDAWRAAGLLLYLETGAIGTHARTLEACRQRYPELCAEIKQLAAELTQDEQRSVFRAYDLLRRCALEINARIERIDPLRLPEPRTLDEESSWRRSGEGG